MGFQGEHQPSLKPSQDKVIGSPIAKIWHLRSIKNFGGIVQHTHHLRLLFVDYFAFDNRNICFECQPCLIAIHLDGLTFVELARQDLER